MLFRSVSQSRYAWYRVAALRKMLAEIKKKARQILELKEETTCILEELNVSAEDTKRIIDFVNSLSGVKLSEEDKKDLRQRIKKNIFNEKENISEKLSKKVEDSFIGHLGNYAGTNLTYASTGDRSMFANQVFTTSANTLQLQDAAEPENNLVLNL